VFAVDFLMRVFVRDRLGVLQRRLRLHCKFIRLHTIPWFCIQNPWKPSELPKQRYYSAKLPPIKDWQTLNFAPGAAQHFLTMFLVRKAAAGSDGIAEKALERH
jgi:hypothetical protein